MKIKQLKIKNIGLISDETIEFNKPLILFYGDIKQGKTTILNAVRWAFGGSFPADIIRHGAQEASIELVFDNGSISRSFYRNKDGETVTRPQNIVINNQVKKVTDLKQFLNPFLLNQNHLTDMNDIDRTKYIIDLFNINTGEIDGQILTKEREASDLRATIKGYGEIVLTPVTAPDMDELESRKASITETIRASSDSVNTENNRLKSEYEAKKQAALQVIIDFNSDQDRRETVISDSKTMLNDIYAKVKGGIFEKCFDIDCAKRTLETLPKPEAKKELTVNIPEPTYKVVDNSAMLAIEAEIQETRVTQVKYEAYLKDKARADAKEVDQVKLKDMETTIRDLRKQRLAKQVEINGKIEGLTADESGIMYEGTAFNMLSTSQLMSLSSKLSDMYPEGFGIELIDHAESLGKSIFGFIERAEKEQKTILATIVGERPANVPTNIGVFVVENGEVK
jgi:DNA repair exonuclease SbcCD ATPase subunit